MLLYNISFPNKNVCGASELYLRGGEFLGDCVFIEGGRRATFDTYFNCFSHVKYKRYTRAREVTLKLELQGKGALSLCRYDGEMTEVLAEKDFDGNCEIGVNIADLQDNGFIYFAIDAKDDCKLYSGGWHCDLQADFVKIGVVICTYKREEYVRRNLSNLTAYTRTLSDRFFDVFVVDNGQTLTDDFGDGVRIIPNENTGGSGGFTRGMKEVCEACAGEYTHFLLMDDDIVFDTELLWRTYAMLGLLKEEYKNASVGGAMLILDRPYVQQVLGDDWDGLNVKSRRKKVDVRNPVEIVLNEEDSEPDYNAWFYMCMPVSTVEKYGYPLPFFIKCDDIEYGLRAAEHVITSSGIAVWHEDFDAKYSPELEYYARRNGLITNARFSKRKGALSCWKKVAFAVGKQLIWQRYFAIDLIYKACEDYFKGPKWFANINSSQLHAELREANPKFLTAEEIEKEYGVSVDVESIGERSDNEPKLSDAFALLAYLVPKCLYKKGVTQVNMMSYTPHEFALKRRLLQYNPATGKGFVTEIKKLPLIKSCFKLIGYFFKFAFRYRSTAKKYREMKTNT
ncbi:MAG: glycosyltransferase [Bacteroides sp.]|nr:glycosyltransferase [Bacillota bacterium]MCM1394365.1 glycosyltransferase [[Eubacterium] siraeum]MCM1456039.1 glycosyltransferase [Bacteroides sp.]